MKRILTGLAVFSILCLFARADEGMWLINRLNDLHLPEKGIKIDLEKIYSPGKPCIANAIVRVGGGTGELVSAHGLLLTNHHVAFRAVQRASTGGTDYIANGFLARTREEEIEAPGYTARILLSMEDVTPRFTSLNKIKDPLKKEKAIKKNIEKITRKIEKGRTDISAEVESMYDGKQYILFVYKRFDDVRAVYVPPLAIGKYGGETDNWIWPRHTGDFSFMRIYTAPDGTGRKYHKDNIPYKPAYWLQVADAGVNEGDITFALGYPGGTQRYRTSHPVRYHLEHVYPFRIKVYEEYIHLLNKFTGDSQVAKAKVLGTIAGLSNGVKFYRGNVEVMKRTNFLQEKIRFENELMTFLGKDKTLADRYGDIPGKIAEQYAFKNSYRDRDEVLRVLGRYGGTMTSAASTIYNMVKERAKPKKLRAPGFSEKKNKRTVSRLHIRYMSFYEPADRAMLIHVLEIASRLPAEQRIKGLDYIIANPGKTVEQWVDEAYQKTRLKDVEYARTMFDKSLEELEALDDPFIGLVKRIDPEREARKKKNKTFDANIDELRKKYIEALYEWKGLGLYPDANGSMRFTYGRVAGYSPRDGVYYQPYTTLRGMLEKDTGEEPFNAPEILKKLYEKKDFGRWKDPRLNDVPVAFIAALDSTGGNSGSPVLDARGQMVGILFDGNSEAMTCDWQYNRDIQRTICVDIRYVLFVTEKAAQARHILKEMGID